VNEDGSLHDRAVAAWYSDDYETLETLSKEMIRAGQSRADAPQLALGYSFAGHACIHREDPQGAHDAYGRALNLFAELGDELGVARVQMSLGVVALELDLDVAEARRLYDIAVPVVRASGDRQRLAIALANLAEIFRQEGDYRQAMGSAHESLEIFREIGDTTYVGWQLFTIAHIQSLVREYPQAIESLRAAFRELRKTENARWLAMYFDIWIILAVELKADECAARLLGFTEEMRAQKKAPRLRGMLPWFLPHMERLSKRISEDTLLALRTEGATLTLDQAQALTDEF
jgi:tetratricopeptide (TPR) repeat protein